MAPVLDVVEFLDPSGDEIVHRVPEAGSGEFRLGSQLVVREGQAAVFFRDGKALDTFGPGRHTLTTANIPFLTELLSLPFGGQSPFRAEAYFVSLRQLTELKWGTPEPIAYRDADLGVVRLRAHGSYSMRVGNPQLFVNKVVGTRGLVGTSAVQTFLRSVIISALTDSLGEQLRSLYDLPRQYEELAIAVRLKARDHFASLGLDLHALFVNAILPPDDVQKAIDERSALGAIGTENMPAYLQYKAGQALGDAAKGGEQGQGGAAATGMGLGVGAGLGMLIPQILGQAGKQGGGETVLLCSNCQAKVPQGSKFCPNCGIKFGEGVPCPNCKNPVPGGAKFCPHCGQDLG